MANTLADRNVLVNAICPGVFPSRMTAYGVTENKELLEAGQPTGECLSLSSLRTYFTKNRAYMRVHIHMTRLCVQRKGWLTLDALTSGIDRPKQAV